MRGRVSRGTGVRSEMWPGWDGSSGDDGLHVAGSTQDPSW